MDKDCAIMPTMSKAREMLKTKSVVVCMLKLKTSRFQVQVDTMHNEPCVLNRLWKLEGARRQGLVSGNLQKYKQPARKFWK